jgi:hypothetical protein
MAVQGPGVGRTSSFVKKLIKFLEDSAEFADIEFGGGSFAKFCPTISHIFLRQKSALIISGAASYRQSTSFIATYRGAPGERCEYSFLRIPRPEWQISSSGSWRRKLAFLERENTRNTGIS